MGVWVCLDYPGAWHFHKGKMNVLLDLSKASVYRGSDFIVLGALAALMHKNKILVSRFEINRFLIHLEGLANLKN